MPAFKMPAFEPDRVERFFEEADDRFLALGIYHPSLKYTAITPYLPSQLLEAISTRHAEIARAGDRYEALRAAVVEYSYRPHWACHYALDVLPSVNASLSPSQLMLRIIALKGSGHPFCDSYRYQFLKRLPMHLFEKFKDKEWDASDPMKFAHLVERSWAPHMAGPTYAAIPSPGYHSNTTTSSSATPNPAPGTGAAVAQVATEQQEEPQDVLDILRPLVAAIQAGRRGSGGFRGSWRGNRGGQRGGSRPQQPASNNQAQGQNQGQNQGQQQQNRPNNNEWCYFHQRFGAQATNCRPPCSYNQRSTGNIRTLQAFDNSL